MVIHVPLQLLHPVQVDTLTIVDLVFILEEQTTSIVFLDTVGMVLVVFNPSLPFQTVQQDNIGMDTLAFKLNHRFKFLHAHQTITGTP